MNRFLQNVLYLSLFSLFLVSCTKEWPCDNNPPIVHAGTDTTYDLTKSGGSSIWLSGSATDADGKVVSYLWSQISGPNAAKIKNPGSNKTQVSGVVSGKYVFQLTATDNMGATGVNTVTITVIRPETTVTITLQSKEDVSDLHLAVNYQGNASDPMAAEIGAVAWTNQGEPAYVRGLLKFNLSGLPANATIKSAKLTLYSNPDPNNGDLQHANYGYNNALLIQRVTSGWDSTTTWATQPSSESTDEIVVSHTNEPFLDLVDIDVTTLVSKMAKGANYGFKLKLQNESYYNSRIFTSSKFPDASKYPKLEVTYTTK
jgi:hypothetical protein